jgi:ParB-like nuclease family protein
MITSGGSRPEMIPVESLVPNTKNPRKITESALQRLAESINLDPKFMELRPIIIDEMRVVIGGNQRLRAIHKIGMKEIPASWVRQAKGLTQEQRDRFIVIDNSPEGMSGFWDWEVLGGIFERPQLVDLGFMFPEPVNTEEMWRGMPEFVQGNAEPHRTVRVHFRNDEDFVTFMQTIGHPFTERTKSIWFPPLAEHEILSGTSEEYMQVEDGEDG